MVQLSRDIGARVGGRVGREIDIDADGDVSAVIDGAKAARILENLVGNAAKYSPEGSHIHVRVNRFGSGVLLVVDDEGPGVPEALRRSIFAPFERGNLTSSHQPGTGIGLSLVDRFARLHGGRAWASFRVYLPDGPAGMAFATVAEEPWGSLGSETKPAA
jgi:signal transduction histidine kinase